VCLFSASVEKVFNALIRLRAQGSKYEKLKKNTNIYLSFLFYSKFVSVLSDFIKYNRRLLP
ncbi:MAG TPA: hypothetical protein DCX01_02095, partial [Bacteroidetes bacterium]|nr:hypothetical protein [Bacteroidota bacterium]